MLRRGTFIFLLLVVSQVCFASPPELHPPIPIRFHLDQPGMVTLVVEDSHGVRVRNLVSEMPFPAGDNTAWWDGLDDLARDLDAASHAVYHVPGKLVPAGVYRVRGIVHAPIDLKYEFTPYFPGNPPWMTADRSSGWLANHTPPSSVCFLPADVAPVRAGQTGPAPAQVIIGSKVSEGGAGIAWVGLDGKKLHGQEWLGGVWTGAQFVARDAGPNKDPGVYAYTVAYWEGDKFDNFKSELRIHGLRTAIAHDKAPKDARFGTGEDFAVLHPTYQVEVAPSAGAKNRLGGLAAYNGVLVVSVPANGQLLLIDAINGTVIGAAKLAGVNGVAFDAQGRLFAVVGKTVIRFDNLAPSPGAPREGGGEGAAAKTKPAAIGEGTATPPSSGVAGEGKNALAEWSTSNTPFITLPAPTIIVSSDLTDPQQLTIDDNGDLYVTDWGDSHQVKVFAADGRFRRAMGHPGGLAIGPYDPNHMNHPNGMAITSDRHLWVAENDFLPKRVSVWTLDGKLLKAFYGPPLYGSGGVIDAADKSRFFMASGGGIEMHLDWTTGDNWPIAIYSRPGDDPLKPLRGDNFTSPQWPVHVNGKTYLVDSYNVNPIQGISTSGAWLYDNGRLKPVAMIGQANDLNAFNPTRSFSARWKGQISAPASGPYTFFVTSTHGSRLWIDGKPIVNNWRKWGGESHGAVTLDAGRHDLTMEIYNDTGPAKAQLAWSGASLKRQPVPTANLFPADAPADARGSGLNATYFSDRNLKDPADTRIDARIDFNWGAAGLKLKTSAPFQSRLPKGVDLSKDKILFAWSDLNDDGQVQSEEITTTRGNVISVCFQPDLSAVTAGGMLLKPSRFTDGGAPVFDANEAKSIIPPDSAQAPVSDGGGQALIASDGNVILTTAPKPFAPQSLGGAGPSGATWSYPSLWPGLHASHIAPLPDEPGELIGTTRLLGPAFSVGDNSLWAINGNKGDIYLFTSDGLFVATLFKDVRLGSWSATQAVRDMSVKDFSLHEECFYPTITETADGNVYLQGGGKIIRVDGLDTLRRLPSADVTLSADDLVAAQKFFVEQESARQAAAKVDTTATIPILPAAPKLDGKLDDWKSVAWLTIDRRSVQVGDWNRRTVVTAAAIAVADGKLFLAVKTDRANLLKNSGEVLTNLFKTGGGIDLMVGSDPSANPRRSEPVAGDQRLLIAQVNDKIVAMRYRQVVPGTKTEPVLYSSPVRTVKFDRVEDISDQVTVATGLENDDKGQLKQADYELAIPLSVLGVTAKVGETIRADVGVLRGSDFQTLQRVYWSNKATGLVSDLPSEAELQPKLWGTWTFGDGR